MICPSILMYKSPPLFCCSLSWLLTKMLLIKVGVLIEDTKFVDSCLGGKPWKAGTFSSSLRLALQSEHLGLPAGEEHLFCLQGSRIEMVWRDFSHHSNLLKVLELTSKVFALLETFHQLLQSKRDRILHRFGIEFGVYLDVYVFC